MRGASEKHRLSAGAGVSVSSQPRSRSPCSRLPGRGRGRLRCAGGNLRHHRQHWPEAAGGPGRLRRRSHAAAHVLPVRRTSSAEGEGSVSCASRRRVHGGRAELHLVELSDAGHRTATAHAAARALAEHAVLSLHRTNELCCIITRPPDPASPPSSAKQPPLRPMPPQVPPWTASPWPAAQPALPRQPRPPPPRWGRRALALPVG